MTYGSDYNLFLKSNTEKTDIEKIKILEEYPCDKLLTLLRNIEECPRKFDEIIINAVARCLFNKGVICM